MAYQTGRNVVVTFGLEDAFGELATTVGAEQLRLNTGSLNLGKARIQSGENRRDGMMTRGRHGSRRVEGSYESDLYLGAFDTILEAMMRGTWDSPLSLTQSDFTSITTTTSTIVFASGSPITLGLRVGDVVRLTNHSQAGNNGRNIRITDLDSTTLTVAETLVAEASPDNSVTITRPKKLLMGVTPRSFTVEEQEVDIDGSEMFKGFRWATGGIALRPDGMGILRMGGMGQDMETLTGGSSPYFVSPTEHAGIGMTSVEAAIRLGSTDVVDLTEIDLGWTTNPQVQPVVGSVLTPDVFLNLFNVSLRVSALRQDLSRVAQYLAETQLSLHLLFTENESEPKDFVSFFVSNMTLGNATKSPVGQDGARTQTFECDVGIDDRGGKWDETMIKIQTSAA
ncbi:MAG: phage tail tube protein [Alphaproteobacteria bacterium]